jgi:hypothetical protein
MNQMWMRCEIFFFLSFGIDHQRVDFFRRITEVVAKLSSPRNDTSSNKGKNKQPQMEFTAEVRAMFAEFLASQGQGAIEK